MFEYLTSCLIDLFSYYHRADYNKTFKRVVQNILPPTETGTDIIRLDVKFDNKILKSLTTSIYNQFVHATRA